MQKTLDHYSIAKNIVSVSDYDRSAYSDLFSANDHELLLSVLNTHEVSYGVTSYFLTSNRSIGFNAIKLLYREMPANRQVVCINYTNIFYPLVSERLINNIWAFPDMKTARHWQKEMIDSSSEVPNTHLYYLPKSVDLEQGVKFADQFVDKYFDHERLEYLNQTLAAHHTDFVRFCKHKLMNDLTIFTISKSELQKIGKMPGKTNLLMRMLNYNNHVEEYNDYKNAFIKTHQYEINQFVNENLNNYLFDKGNYEIVQLVRRAKRLSGQYYDLHNYYKPISVHSVQQKMLNR